MAWIAPAVLGIVGMVSQQSQTAAANKNNLNQQTAEIQNAQAVTANATAQMAPWLTQGASPYGKANSVATNAVHPLALAGNVPTNAPAPQQVMQPPQQQQPQQQPQQRRMPQAQPQMGAQPGQPAQPQKPMQQPTPQQVAQIQAIMRGPSTLNTGTVTL